MNVLTVRQLKDMLKSMPDKNRYGEDFEVWVENGLNLSVCAKSCDVLNKREDGSDLIISIIE